MFYHGIMVKFSSNLSSVYKKELGYIFFTNYLEFSSLVSIKQIFLVALPITKVGVKILLNTASLNH